MTYSPASIEVLFLLRLLTAGGAEFQLAIKPELEASRRHALENAGLIETTKRRRPASRNRRVNYISLTDLGWRWLSDHLDIEISTRSTAAVPVLHELLVRLKGFLHQNNSSLAEFISGTEVITDHATTSAAAIEVDLGDYASRVRTAYFELTGQRPGRRVRLADLRTRLQDVSEADLNTALLDMERAESIVLYPLDDPQELYPEDERAALPNSAGDQRHIVYMEN